MSGYVTAMGSCIGCGRLFAFNPHKVPSSSAATGKREPICADCIVRINAKRAELGYEPIMVEPDAYEAIPEGEL